MIRVLKKRLCVRPEPTNKTPGGLYIPDLYVPDTNRAHVVAAGPEAQCRAGDRVIVAEWAHNAVDDETCHRIGEAPGLRFLHEDNVRMRCESGGQWRCLDGFVLVRLDAQRTHVDGTVLDVLLPEVCRDQPTTGVVVLAGEGVECKAGDRILFGKWNGAQLEPETLLEMGYEQDAQLFVMREVNLHEITGPSGRKHRVVADEVHGVLDAEAAQ